MTNYALVAPDNTIHTERDERRIDLTAGTKDGYRWLPVENVEDDTGYTPGNPDFVSSRADPYQVVEATRVTRNTIKRDMTQAEIDARLAARYEGMDEIQNRAILMLFKVCWALWTNAGGNAAQLDNSITNSPVTGQMVKDRVLR